jgi:hypothetical protein
MQWHRNPQMRVILKVEGSELARKRISRRVNRTLSGEVSKRLENLKREPNATSVQLVKSMNLTIRDLNESVFRRFKARAVEEGMKLGEALTQAMDIWIKQSTDKPERSLLDLETFDWGKGAEKVSAKIDEIMYG